MVLLPFKELKKVSSTTNLWTTVKIIILCIDTTLIGAIEYEPQQKCIRLNGIDISLDYDTIDVSSDSQIISK